MTGSSLVVVLTSPSGTGKSTIIRDLLEGDPRLAFSVSHTTRPPRDEERHGVDYQFITRHCFEELRAAGTFLEWAEYNGDLYGTSQEEVRRARGAGLDLLLEIEVQGARQISVRIPEAVTIFLMPPGYPELVRRLRGRGTESEASIERRLRTASREIRHYPEFRYLVVNGTVAQAMREIREILDSERGLAAGASDLRTSARRALADGIVATFPEPGPGPGRAPMDPGTSGGGAGSPGAPA